MTEWIKHAIELIRYLGSLYNIYRKPSRIIINVTDITSSSSDDLIVRIRWYIYLRWFILLVVIVPGLISIYIGQGWSDKLQYDAFLGLIALATNAIFLLVSLFMKHRRAIQVFATTVFLVDIALITYFIYTKSGVDSRSVMIYVIPIIMSAAIFGRKGAYIFALLSIIAYDALILSNYFGLFYSQNMGDVARQTNFAHVLNSIVFFNSILILISFAVDFIAGILTSKEKLATKHLEDLKRAQAIAKFGSWEWDKNSDTIIWSDELYDIFGAVRSTTPMTFDKYVEYIHPEDKKLLISIIKKASTKAGVFAVDHRVVLPDGTIRHIHSDGQSFANDQGVIKRMIGTARDTTDSKLLEKAKNDFVSLTSHQLRTPATIVKQYTMMLNEGYAGKLTPKQSKFLQTIYSSNERQIAIINDLLSIARIDSGTFTLDIKRTDIVALLRTITDEHLGKYKIKQQKLIFKPQYKSVYCEIDSDQLQMAIENLLDNAHKYSPEKKTVRIELKRKKTHVRLQIIDHGVGIPMQNLDTIFTMFSRIDNPTVLQEEGTGIGLYWAKKIITLHDGTISVVSEQGKGTIFTLDIPYKHNDKL